ncbi:hypothetical protein DFS33DRAFT_777531 [Desarmillaria ectypa]|nr:hypothetical protein DFS33DRAFT_777531 [Desarmillaria ectypa]
MEDKRSQTLQALSTYIASQKELLARTHSDIERLHELQKKACSNPRTVVDELAEELSDRSFKLSDLAQDQAGAPLHIDWSTYDHHDPLPFQNLACKARMTYDQRNTPHTKQHSELSDLQKYVKEARQTVLDPIFQQLNLSWNPEVIETAKIHASHAEIKRDFERDKIRELKQHKITTSSGLTVSSSRVPIGLGVFIRRDVEDESMDVDISLDDTTPLLTKPTIIIPRLSVLNHKASRVRRSTAKIQIDGGGGGGDLDCDNLASELLPKSRLNPPNAKNELAPDSPAKSSLGKRTRGPGKPKPETYNQAWSVSEQHLLERLLDEIPEGEKNRWKKISQAMDNKRTPRQVASRVQKYFEKLKRFGVG